MKPKELQERINSLYKGVENLVKDIDLTERNEDDEDRIEVYQIIRERVYMVGKDLQEISETEFPDYIF